uniref:Apolipoprotein L n=1 Tax=Seriola lalandi dorsalis TaxID=1841481 RepID=A0A3B4XZA6_SERLL
MLKRETELNMMMDIKNRADNIDLNVNHVTQSQDKGKAFLEYMKSKVTQVTADSRRAELEEELAAVLKDTLGGLEKLDCFLDAVEKLAVTSLHVFMENRVLHLPEGIALEHPRMLQFLNELEESAVQLDRMNKGAKISSVAGSSVGAVGGVLSIIGLALIPVTAGVSLALTMTGVGLGITSGVNSVVTTATEVGVNVTQQKKASEVLKLFMEDVQSLQDCLEEVTNRETTEISVVVEVSKVLCKAGVVGKNIDALVDVASAAKLAAADIPDIGQAAVKGPLALSKSARAATNVNLMMVLEEKLWDLSYVFNIHDTIIQLEHHLGLTTSGSDFPVQHPLFL